MNTRRLTTYSTAALVTAILGPTVHAGLTVLTDPNWTRPTDETVAGATGTTYQRWDVFSQAGPPVLPDTIANVPALGGINPNGDSDVYDSAPSSGAFITSSGNIYSFSGVINPRAIVPTPNAWTRFYVQATSFGREIQTDDLTVNGVDATSLGGYSYTQLQQFAVDPGLGFPGVGDSLVTDYLWTFVAPPSSTYTLDWGWGVTSSSVDQIIVDTQLAGDFDLDGDVDADDIDLLAVTAPATVPARVPGVTTAPANALYDLDHDNAVDFTIDADGDADLIIRTVLGTEYGDANLDGAVNIVDLGILATFFGGSGGWATGDFNGDQTVNIVDLGILATYFGFNSNSPLDAVVAEALAAGDLDRALELASVPEPATLTLLAAGVAIAARRRGGTARA